MCLLFSGLVLIWHSYLASSSSRTRRTRSVHVSESSEGSSRITGWKRRSDVYVYRPTERMLSFSAEEMIQESCKRFKILGLILLCLGSSALGFELAIPYRRGIFYVARQPKAFVKSEFGYLAGEEQA